MEGDGRGALGSFGGASYVTLSDFIQENPLRNNGDEWLLKLMEHDELIAVRIMEVREAYAKDDFEWNNLQRVTVEELSKGNVGVMRKHAQSKFGGLLMQMDENEGAEEER